jgi:N-acetylneuraminate synthase
MTQSGCFVIAEAGVNHDGDPAKGVALIDVAAAARADAVKFQAFDPAALVTRRAAKAAYQARNMSGDATGQFEMLRSLTLDRAQMRALADHTRAKGIEFMATPFDADSLRFLVGEVGVNRIKISSGDVTFGPLLLAAARTGLPALLSTGMSTLADVERMLAVYAFGLLEPKARPTDGALIEAYASPAGRAALRARATLLHCTTEYPAPPETANLKAMDTLAAFGVPVGYSDHTAGTAIAMAAVARGAVALEKHFTLDRRAPGPDHAASLEPRGLAELVAGIRAVSASLGDGIKRPLGAEIENLVVARRAIVAGREIAEGEIFDDANLAAKRPATGRSPMETWNLIGRRARRAYAADEAIDDA